MLEFCVVGLLISSETCLTSLIDEKAKNWFPYMKTLEQVDGLKSTWIFERKVGSQVFVVLLLTYCYLSYFRVSVKNEFNLAQMVSYRIKWLLYP